MLFPLPVGTLLTSEAAALHLAELSGRNPQFLEENLLSGRLKATGKAPGARKEVQGKEGSLLGAMREWVGVDLRRRRGVPGRASQTPKQEA